MRRVWWWLRHAGYAHYTPDLGAIIRIESHWWGEVLIRECAKCGRHFVDFGAGMPDCPEPLCRR